MDEKNKIPGVSFIKRNIGTIIGLILLVIIVSISTPKFLTSSNILNLLKSNSVNAIISCGMLLAILMGEIDISVGSTVGLSGIIGAYMITNVGLPVVPTVLICTGRYCKRCCYFLFKGAGFCSHTCYTEYWPWSY